METYIIFHNKNGKRKLAVCLNKRISIFELTEKLTTFINDICETNKYTFSYENIDTKTDYLGRLKNIPIINAKAF